MILLHLSPRNWQEKFEVLKFTNCTPFLIYIVDLMFGSLFDLMVEWLGACMIVCLGGWVFNCSMMGDSMIAGSMHRYVVGWFCSFVFGGWVFWSLVFWVVGCFTPTSVFQWVIHQVTINWCCLGLLDTHNGNWNEKSGAELVPIESYLLKKICTRHEIWEV